MPHILPLLRKAEVIAMLRLARCVEGLKARWREGDLAYFTFLSTFYGLWTAEHATEVHYL